MIVEEATYDSRCPACDELIFVGDEITPDDDGEWVHVACVDE